MGTTVLNKGLKYASSTLTFLLHLKNVCSTFLYIFLHVENWTWYNYIIGKFELYSSFSIFIFCYPTKLILKR